VKTHKLGWMLAVFLWTPWFGDCATLTVGLSGGFDFQTLTEAVPSASAGDTIQVAEGVYDTTRGEVFPIRIEKPLSVVGSSSDEVIVNATGSESGCFVIDPQGGFLIAGMTICGGSSEEGGGGILATSGIGFIRDVTFRGNTTTLRGGGAFLNGAQTVTVEDCVFEENHAPGIVEIRSPGSGGVRNGEGGGLSVGLFSGQYAYIKNCRFLRNSASDEGTALRLDGSRSNALIEDCTFEENRYGVFELSGSRIATAYVNGMLDVTFARCLFRNNRRETFMSTNDFFNSRVYVLYQEDTHGQGSLAIEDCEFSNNQGMGGVRIGNGSIVDSMVFENGGNGLEVSDGVARRCSIRRNALTGVLLRTQDLDTSIHDCDIAFNGQGVFENDLRTRIGGVSLLGNRFEISECSIVGNVGRNEPGGVAAFVDFLSMSNCIIVGNETSGQFNPVGGLGVPGGSRLGVLNLTNVSIAGNISDPSPAYEGRGPDGIHIDPPADVRISNSILWDGTRSIEWDDEANVSLTFCNLFAPLEGEGNISEDPLFLHPWDGETADLRLPCESPCVDSGTSDGAPSTDIEWTTRPRGAGIDMGAYENCHFDLNGDRSEDVKDLLSFPPEWYRPTDETNFGFDVYRDGPSQDRIDRLDLDELLEELKGP